MVMNEVIFFPAARFKLAALACFLPRLLLPQRSQRWRPSGGRLRRARARWRLLRLVLLLRHNTSVLPPNWLARCRCSCHARRHASRPGG